MKMLVKGAVTQAHLVAALSKEIFVNCSAEGPLTAASGLKKLDTDRRYCI
jgi:hypothetical protein